MIFLVLATLAPLVLLDVNTVRGWHQSPDLFPTSYYLINEALLAWLAFDLLLLGFLAFKRGRRALCHILLLGCGLLCLYVVLDFGCLELTNDSSGPGGRLCISHMNWYRRFVHNNAQGYWEDDLAPYAPPHKKPVLALVGDSFTWGQGLKGRQLRFGDILRRELPDLEVLNFGRGGLNTQEEMNMILPDLPRVKPDVVLVCYLSNDIHDGVKLVRTEQAPMSFWQQRLLVASPLYNYIYWREGLGQGGSASLAFFSLVANYLDDKTFADHTKDLDEMIARIRAMGAKPVFAIMPFPHMWTDFRPDVRNRIYAKLTTAIEAQHVPVIPLYQLEEKYPVGHFEVGPMDAHPSPAVNRAMAAMIEAWLKAHPEVGGKSG